MNRFAPGALAAALLALPARASAQSAGPIRIGSHLNDIGAERLYAAALAEMMNPELSGKP